MNESDLQLLTIPAAARLLSVSRGHIYNMLAHGSIRSVKLPGATDRLTARRIRRRDVMELIDSCSV